MNTAALLTLALTGLAQAAGGWGCALHVIELVAACVGPTWICPVSMVLAACACVDDFAEEHDGVCPG
jgi:hypothetical protein